MFNVHKPLAHRASGFRFIPKGFDARRRVGVGWEWGWGVEGASYCRQEDSNSQIVSAVGLE